MDRRLRYAARYALAFVGSLVALPLVQVAASLIAGDREWVADPASSWCCRIPMLVFVILPLCAVAEFELLWRRRLPWWAYLPSMAVVLFLASVATSSAMVSLMLGSVPGGFDVEVFGRGRVILGVQDVLWSGAGWTLLRFGDTLLPAAKPETSQDRPTSPCE